ncbi:sirohydrochlorin ferrochelatase [Tamaricihabitans halophyticus]|uniref:Sirohydrochlorin ferrochelatase n=1 Tax=Tamaricihabitans halophyticus TaxID=1262583 RepID=A0A4R2QZR2_9PSEU|nr:sirohydrochlorin chelatase [Tamaricihabitans halophyticus]TCP54884.1 sirohydrochlorin ferrochelatase [Tamaricihabitans halophyticus]
MTAPPLIAVAHGSRDPRSAATVHALLDVLKQRQPGLDVRGAFLDLSAPRLGDVLGAVHGEGARDIKKGAAVVVPLLLGNAYHAKVDIPALITEASARLPRLAVHTSDVLGPDSALEETALRRLTEAGVSPHDPELGVVLAGTGSSSASANAVVARIAASWQERFGWAGVAAGFAAAEPGLAEAARVLRARGARRIAVASWFLAPGLLLDRITNQAAEADAAAVVAEPLGPAPEVADLVFRRYLASLPAEVDERRYA